jgi:REP element-mobilizing transposase RayT
MLENNIYHIYNRGNNKENIFFEEKNYQFFLQRFRYYLDELVNVYAYCLMPNHFHVLLEVKNDGESINLKTANNELSPLEIAFKCFFMSYSKAINKAYNRTGSLFQTKFKRKPITNDAYLNNIVAYIHLNPVRAGLVKNAENWNFSSYKSYLKDLDDIIISDKNDVLEWFRGKENFIDFHKIYKDFQNDRDYLFN